ncbi:unnamed protein product, partial [marine sediment metagenome]
YGENVQEAYDNIIQAVKIAETSRLPVMPCIDGNKLKMCLSYVSSSSTLR